MSRREINFRPLSEGIGLGNLQSTPPLEGQSSGTSQIYSEETSSTGHNLKSNVNANSNLFTNSRSRQVSNSDAATSQRAIRGEYSRDPFEKHDAEQNIPTHIQNLSFHRAVDDTIFKDSSKNRVPSQVNPSSPHDLVGLPTISAPVMSQAHAAYAPHSVAAELKSGAAYQWNFKIVRFLVGIGSDIAVSIVSLVLMSWAGVIAWNAGETGSVDVMGALNTIIGILKSVSLLQATCAVALLFVFWRVGKKLILK